MPFIPTPNGIKVELRYTQELQRVENVFWFLGPNAGVSLVDLQTVTDFVWNWWQDSLQPLQSNQVQLREIYATDQSAVDGETYTYSPSFTAVGTNTNAALPNNVTIAVSLRTSKRGRSFRGRSYFVGLTENMVDGSSLAAASQTAIVAAYDALVSGAAVAGYQLCVCSQRANGNPRTAGILTPVVDALLVDGVVDSQRRRLPNRGQ